MREHLEKMHETGESLTPAQEEELQKFGIDQEESKNQGLDPEQEQDAQETSKNPYVTAKMVQLLESDVNPSDEVG